MSNKIIMLNERKAQDLAAYLVNKVSNDDTLSRKVVLTEKFLKTINEFIKENGLPERDPNKSIEL